MAVASIRWGATMGAGSPVYAPIPARTQSVADISEAFTSQPSPGGSYARVKILTGPAWVAVNSTAAEGVYDLLASGDHIDYGPLKEGDTISIVTAE
jgi:hypothetical protein